MDLVHFGHSGNLSGEERTPNHREQSAPVREVFLETQKPVVWGLIQAGEVRAVSCVWDFCLLL